MFKTYLTVAFRSLLKRRVNALINIIGLALGIASTIIIVLFARNELTYDQFHKNSDRTYLVYKERVTPNGIQPTYDTWVPLMERLQTEYPEVDLGTRFFNAGFTLQIGNQRFEEEGYFIDPSYFKVFDFPLIQGDNRQPFPNKQSMIISMDMAKKFFGEADPIGQEIRINFDQIYTVSGVLKDYPENGFVGAEILLPIESDPEYAEYLNNWNSSFLMTFITLGPAVDPFVLEEKFPGFVKDIWDEETAARTNFKLLPLHQAYDTFVGDSRDSYLLLYIALGIILIAVTNFMNLSTARSMDRAREIGMRKVLGAAKRQLITQFFFESILISFVALLVGLALAGMTLPFINSIFDLELSIPHYSEPLTIPILLGFGLLVGLLSGSYPAIFMANFRILESLNKVYNNKLSGVTIRNTLVVAQFAISLILVVGTITIAWQINYVKNADLAFNKDNLMIVPVSERDFEDSDEARIKLATFRNELKRHPHIKSMTTSRHVPGRWSGSNTFVRPEGWEGAPMRMRYTIMDANFFDSYQIQLKEGPGFLPDTEGDQRESVVLNEAAMQAFGWADINDKNILIGDRKIQVVGLIQNFNYESLRSEIDPILHLHRVPESSAHRYLSLRVSEDNFSQALSFLKDQWTILDPSRPFQYFFVTEDFRELYANEDRFLALVKIFAILSIFISCLGLFGLLSFNLDKRKKEMGIRKILGATPLNLTFMVSYEFIGLIIISFLIACPLGYFFMNRWLNEFAYHINLGWQVFALAILLTMSLAFLTISFKTIKTANANPVDSILEG